MITCKQSLSLKWRVKGLKHNSNSYTAILTEENQKWPACLWKRQFRCWHHFCLVPICKLYSEMQLTTSIYESGLYKVTINQLLIGCSNGTSVTLKMHWVEFKDFIENSDIHIRTFSTSCWLVSARYWKELSKFHLFTSMIILALQWTLLMCPPQFVVITEQTLIMLGQPSVQASLEPEATQKLPSLKVALTQRPKAWWPTSNKTSEL